MICRCKWVNLKNPAYIAYHDSEWGQPCHEDRMLFELLVLESFQAGLSWECILNKRGSFRKAYDNFDVKKVSGYDEAKIMSLMSDKDIIRNRLKIKASVENSKIFRAIQAEFGSFDNYIWHFTGGKTIAESYIIRTFSPLSTEVSADLKKRGMKFVGTTIIYSYLQAIGVINGHGSECSYFVRRKDTNQIAC